jgi:predicted  nucleic acid-binding Zn-ribbon protein
MSYQPVPPGAPQAFAGSAPAAPAPGARKPALIGVGALLLAAGVVSGIVMFLASSSNYDDGVKNLARAPIGCVTELDFASAGTFTIYAETKGSIGSLRGDCPNTDTEYEFSGDGTPDVDVVITDDSGDEVDQNRDDSTDYDAGGAVGQSIATVEIDEAGTYEISVTSDDEDFVIAVGKDPKATADSLTTNGIIAIVAGIVIGGLLLALGMRRGKPATPASPMYAPGAAAPPQTYAPAPQAAYPPTSYPPVMPPTVQQPVQQPPAAPGWPPAAPPAPPASGPLWPAPPNG